MQVKVGDNAYATLPDPTSAPKPRKRSGISGDRAYRIQTKLKARLLDIISQGVCFKLTHDEVCEQVRDKVMGDSDWKKAPAYVHTYIQGVWDAKRDEMYRYHIVWVLSCDGKLMTSKEVDELTKKEKEELYAAHVKWCEDSVSEYNKNGGSCRRPDTLEEFSRNFSRGIAVGLGIRSVDYKSPWSRIDGDLSRHVWKDAQGNPMLHKPYDRKFIPVVEAQVI